MAESSSISSSDSLLKQFTIPWAFLLSIGIFALVEIYLHTRDPHTLIAYPQLAAADDQTVTYKAVREYIELDGPAEIALIGSSQMREGVSMPYLIDQLKSRGVTNSVANYSVRGARVDVMETIIHLLSRQKKQPKLIIIGMSVRDLRGEPDYPRMATFWDAGKYFREIDSQNGFSKLPVTPIVIRNELGEISNTLRYRDQLAMSFAKPFEMFGVVYRQDLNPIIGQQAFQLQGNRGLKRLDEALAGRVSLRKILANARKNYYWNEPPEPNPLLLSRLDMAMKTTRVHGIRTIIVEMPVAKVWDNELQKSGLSGAFNKAMVNSTTGTEVRFVQVKDQPGEYTDEYFSDLQHHNRPGAERFSLWLAGEIADIMKSKNAIAQP